MKRRTFILFSLFLAVPAAAGNLWNRENDVYSNKKRFSPGDRIKIVFNEKSLVDYNLSLSETSRSSGSAGGGQSVMYFDFLPALSGDGSFSVSQKSGTRNRNVISKSITAEVVRVLTNGNLRISGRHYIRVNDTMEQILVDGQVNPDDIRNKKIIYSTDIINPSIVYNSQIVKQEILAGNDFIRGAVTNTVVVSGVTQSRVSPKFDVAERKKQELILQYLNRILTILFK